MTSTKRVLCLVLLIGSCLGSDGVPAFGWRLHDGPMGGAGGSQLRIAVLKVRSNTADESWLTSGATDTQDLLVAELRKSGKFVVFESAQTNAAMDAGHIAIDQELDPTAVRLLGKILGVDYLLVTTVIEYGADVGFRDHGGAAMSAHLVSTHTGSIIWSGSTQRRAIRSGGDEANQWDLKGPGRGVSYQQLWDEVLRPCAHELATKLADAKQQ